MAGRLAGKVALVTGAGSRGPGIGNGRATSILFAREGARVALLDERRDWVEATRALIEAEGPAETLVLEADVTEPEQCRRAVAAVVERWGRLDILVNNVGLAGPPGTAVDVDLEAWDRGLRVNVTSMMLMARFAIPEMRKAGGGSIVNLASIAGLFGTGTNILYSTSKGAVVNLTRGMAQQHGPEGIRVNAIAPGMVYTPMVEDAVTPELREARRLASLLKTEGTGWDVGQAAVFLASDESRWVTGVVLPVDAGFSAGRDSPVPNH